MKLIYKCRTCGETDKEKFYGWLPSLCKTCRNNYVRGQQLKGKPIEELARLRDYHLKRAGILNAEIIWRKK